MSGNENNSYVRVVRHCCVCGTFLPGPGRWEYCPDNPTCQAVKIAKQKAYASAYYAKYGHRSIKKPKPLLGPEPSKKSRRACPFCGSQTVNHFACSHCLSIRSGGIDDAYGDPM